MQVQVNTDRNITGDATAIDLVEAMVRDALDRFSAQITRVEVHLSDQNSNKKGGNDDLRCAMEARVAGLQPIAVTHSAATMEEAANGAAGKLKRSLESTFGRLNQR